MSSPLLPYQKLYSGFLPKEFPVIERIEVKPKNVPEDLAGRIFTVDIHLKPKNGVKGNIAWKPFLNKVKKRMFELHRYLGAKPIVDINIYHEGEIIGQGFITL